MIDQTPHLALPFLMPQQAQKHVTVNETLAMLDALVQLRLDQTVDTPPPTPSAGLRVLVSSAPQGVFAGQAGKIAVFVDGDWVFAQPREGWIAYLGDTSAIAFFDGAAWQPLSAGFSGQAELDRLSINTAPDPNHHLSLKGDSSLFDHNGGGHRVIVNKASSTESASVVFQDGFSGRGELALDNNNQMALNVSTDGANWSPALSVDPASGISTATGLRSGLINIDKDTAVQIPTPAGGGFFFLIITSPNYARADYSGFFAFDTGLSPALTPLALSANVTGQNSAPLTGTTGPASHVNVSAGTGALTVESRYPSLKTFSYTFIC